jgi:hypothetical protein
MCMVITATAHASTLNAGMRVLHVGHGNAILISAGPYQ